MIHFIVPLYNEEDSLGKNTRHLNKFLNLHLKQEYEIVLSDDGSIDRTHEIAQSLENSLPPVRVVGYSPNRGRGYAVKYASRSCSGDYIIFVDLDFPQTTNLERILKMIDSLKKNQVVIGSRYLPESETKRFLIRSLVSSAYRLLVKLLFPWIKIKDPDIGFKGFHTPYLLKINRLSKMDRWSWDLEVVIIAQNNNLKIEEIPIDWNERHSHYTSSVKIFKAILEEFFGMLKIKGNLSRGCYEFKD